MKATFRGDPRDNFSGPDEITVHGVRFKKDKAVEVDDEVGAKLATHSHFETTAPKADKNTRRSAADAAADNVGGEEAIIGSTTGDPETATREQLIAMSESNREPTDPQGEPGPGSGGAATPAARTSGRASAKS